ncbi:MAG: UDP-3-O-(3-hydroxymyristoyl)glucosamine N-acyltransferase [Bacteroidia bacterium]|nr:UDP-3-O-(3-hydroxymyristoyl)glucosamine N-acyltransferase [Bacteroidia bacterium]
MKLPRNYTLKEISLIINAEINGNADFIISGLNEIHKVEPGDLTFVDHPKYYEKALNSDASAVIINKEMAETKGKMLIYSDNPFRDFNKLTACFSTFQPGINMISPSASIGRNTTIQPGTFIGQHVSIGDNCIIHSNVSIYDHVSIGNNVIIHANTVIGSDALYFKRSPEGYEKLLSCGKVIIEDDVEVGANCAIDRGVSGDTVVGRGTKMDNLIHIAHDTVIGKNCLFAAQVGIGGCVTIEDNVILWGQVGVQKNVTIGSGAIVLGQSGVTKSLEGNKTYFGTPAYEAQKKLKELVYMKQLPELFSNGHG